MFEDDIKAFTATNGTYTTTLADLRLENFFSATGGKDARRTLATYMVIICSSHLNS